MDPSWIDILAVLCWPVGALGVVAFIGLYRVRDRLDRPVRQALGLAALSLLLGPFLFIFFEGNESVVMLVNFDLFMVLLGGLLVVGFIVLVRRPRVDMTTGWRAVLCSLIGIGFIVYGGWSLVGDFLMPRDQIVGYITGTSHRFRIRGPDDYGVSINGIRFKTTGEVFGRVHTGERVRAEIGAGSNVVLQIQKL
jgi:hypothetical protein